MLKLKNISKQYLNQKVLNQINITFRKKEFVSILGPSGSGKTTLLNIIGALEKPDEGEIIIGGTTTKKYKETIWDSYRNQLVGMIFQDYNIIEHLTVLENVELGQIIKGKKEKQKAIKILETLNLKNEINKFPSQLSGGQKQRVAIARAIINEPSIIIADEPTGALDSKTSKEILKILKKLSQKKLVIMVTHNEELAYKYSNRIIKIKDGIITKDTNPYEEVKIEKITLKKTKMTLLNSLHISLKNLLTKKGRTILVSIASSIGISGIALVLSLSNGVNKYIKETEKEYVENYPITIYKQLNLLNLSLTEEINISGQDGIITSTNDIANKILNQNTKYNDMQTLKKHLDKGVLNKYITEIKYNYYIEPQLYTKNYNKVEYNQENIYYELPNNNDLIEKNYELLKGKIPQNKNEIAIIISKNNTINDSLLYALEIKNKNELSNIYKEILENKEIKETKYNYDEILNKTYKLILNTAYFQKENKTYVDKTNNKEYMKKIINEAIDIKIVGILKPKNDVTFDNLIAYRSTLTSYLISENKNTKLGKEQYQNKKINILTNKEFDNQTNTYESILQYLGINNLENPDEITIYTENQENKEKIIKEIEKYNENNEKITYTDDIKEILKTITKIVNTISYILIGFITISLIVSSIMVSIITYISVLERTKEIGILKSLGASRKDIKKIFKAETIIEGFLSGIIGILFAIMLNKIINIVVNELYNINNILLLDHKIGILLIILSTLLALISGLLPANKASKKDPIKALKN